MGVHLGQDGGGGLLVQIAQAHQRVRLGPLLSGGQRYARQGQAYQRAGRQSDGPFGLVHMYDLRLGGGAAPQASPPFFLQIMVSVCRPKLTAMALSTRCICVSSSRPMCSRSRFLSRVRICSSSTTESLGNP